MHLRQLKNPNQSITSSQNTMTFQEGVPGRATRSHDRRRSLSHTRTQTRRRSRSHFGVSTAHKSFVSMAPKSTVLSSAMVFYQHKQLTPSTCRGLQDINKAHTCMRHYTDPRMQMEPELRIGKLGTHHVPSHVFGSGRDPSPHRKPECHFIVDSRPMLNYCYRR